MAKQYKTLFVLLFISYLLSVELAAATATTTSAKASKRALNFIKVSCKRTPYSNECVRTLSTYANTIQTSPQRLVKTALAVTLKHVQSTKLFISHLRDSQFRTLQDCAPSTDTFNSDCLDKAAEELRNSGGGSDQSHSLSHMRNAQAWITSAEDDHSVENTCSGRFSAKANSVQSRLVSLRKEATNLISLSNAFAKN